MVKKNDFFLLQYIINVKFENNKMIILFYNHSS